MSSLNSTSSDDGTNKGSKPGPDPAKQLYEKFSSALEREYSDIYQSLRLAIFVSEADVAENWCRLPYLRYLLSPDMAKHALEIVRQMLDEADTSGADLTLHWRYLNTDHKHKLALEKATCASYSADLDPVNPILEELNPWPKVIHEFELCLNHVFENLQFRRLAAQHVQAGCHDGTVTGIRHWPLKARCEYFENPFKRSLVKERGLREYIQIFGESAPSRLSVMKTVLSDLEGTGLEGSVLSQEGDIASSAADSSVWKNNPLQPSTQVQRIIDEHISLLRESTIGSFNRRGSLSSNAPTLIGG
ncbi:hypothetical protein NCC49_004709 [Naganishia albida]|nr:hypothetical protein NCC49_004709 [Naganishia albida]